MDKIKALLLNDKAIVVYSKILRSILAIGITYVIFRMITALAKKVISKNEKTSDDRKMKTVTSVVRSLFKYLFYILVFIQVLYIFDVNKSFTLSLSGAVALAVGLGAQDLIKDIIAGVFIMIEDKFNVGDTVIIHDYEGYVEALGLRVTKIRGYDGSLKIINNSSLTELINRSKGSQRAVAKLRMNYGTDISVIEDFLRKMKKPLKEKCPYMSRAPYIFAIEMLPSSIELTVVSWVEQGGNWVNLEYQMKSLFVKAYNSKELESTGFKVVLDMEDI